MKAKIAIAFLSISVLISFGLASNQAFAVSHNIFVPQTCEDCDVLEQLFLEECGVNAQFISPLCEELFADLQTCRATFCRAVGGDMIQIETTSVLAAGAQYTAAWMIPIIVSAAGIGLLIQAQKTKLKHNSCPSCKLESEDIFDLGEKTVGKCDNPKCQVSLFFVE